MSKTEFKPFDRVLVRSNNEYKWQVDFFSHYEEDDNCMFPRYICIGSSWHKCIPYEGNKHLIGTTDAPEEGWKPEKGDIVAVSNSGEIWFIGVFTGYKDTRSPYAAVCSSSVELTYNYCEPAEKHFPEMERSNQ